MIRFVIVGALIAFFSFWIMNWYWPGSTAYFYHDITYRLAVGVVASILGSVFLLKR